jgi:hypothetical protein
MDLLHNGMLTDENFTTGLVIVFITHYIADFLLQPRWMAEQKSQNIFVCLQHCSIIWLATFLVYVPLIGAGKGLVMSFGLMR